MHQAHAIARSMAAARDTWGARTSRTLAHQHTMRTQPPPPPAHLAQRKQPLDLVCQRHHAGRRLARAHNLRLGRRRPRLCGGERAAVLQAKCRQLPAHAGKLCLQGSILCSQGLGFCSSGSSGESVVGARRGGACSARDALGAAAAAAAGRAMQSHATHQTLQTCQHPQQPRAGANRRARGWAACLAGHGAPSRP